ncbi:methyltransferase [Paenibacillus ferrarius]|uniref:methyltransferase n=1 Tax=Paenibacillus ferrarius TaxID=1469647 RepID=UPI003D2B8CC2
MMGYSTEWDQRYAENAHMSTWPWSDLVSYVMRYARPDKSPYNVLELGCGAGANIPFFLSLNVNYYAIEGSQIIVNKLKKQFPTIADNIIVGDFTKEINFPVTFDLIVDRGSLTSNATSDIRKCLKMVRKLMNENAKYVGIGWFSTENSEYRKGVFVEDEYTRKLIEDGPLSGIGAVHFSNQTHLEDLFQDYKFSVLEHCKTDRVLPQNSFNNAFWNFIAEQKEGTQ